MAARKKQEPRAPVATPVSVRFDAEDLEKLEAARSAAGITLSEFIRQAALGQATPLYPLQRPLAELTAILLELRRRLAGPKHLDAIETQRLEIQTVAIRRLVVVLIRASGRQLT